jgi:hypothetical protein
MPDPAKTHVEDVDRELDRVDKALKAAGYAKIKQGSVNVPGFRMIQTWIKRGATVYLLFNEAGQFELLGSVFGDDNPSADGIAVALGAK